MIALARTELDEAWDIAIDEIKGRLFTTTQILNAMRKVGTLAGTEWQKTARRLVPVRAFRLRDRGAKEWRIVYRKRQEILYAKTQADKAAFAEASLDVLIAELDITQVGLSSTEPESKAAAAVQQLVEQLSG